MKQTYLALTAAVAILLLGCENELYIKDEGNLVPKTVEEDPSIPSIFVNGTQLHSEAFGNPNDPMVVFLHGGPGCDYRNAMSLQELTTLGYYVVFYDQRSTGLSKRHSADTFTLEQVFDDLEGVIAHYKTSPNQKVFLFGHSWGAMLATGYVNKYPSAIAGLILAEPGGFTWDEILEQHGRIRELKVFSESINDVLYSDQFITGRENYHAILDYKFEMMSSSTYAKGNAEGIDGPSPLWRYGAVVNSAYFELGKRDGLDFTANLGKYEQKVTFLYSENNKGYGRDWALKMAGHYQNTEVFEIDGTGHEMIYFKWQTVRPIVLNYLNSLR